MLRRVTSFAFAGLVAWCSTAWAFADPGTDEPTLRYSLFVDGEEFAIEPGKPIQLSGDFKSPMVELRPGATRQFNYAGLSFEYPANYVWEAEPDPESINMWTMDGADISLMVFESPYPFGAADFMDGLLDSFGDADVQPAELSAGGLVLQGQRLLGQIFDEPIRYEAFNIPSDGTSRLLVIMDTSDDPGAVSEDYEESVALLKSTFRITEQATAETARLQAMVTELASLEAQLESLRVTFNDDHSLIVEMQKRIDAQRDKIAAHREEF